MEKLLREKLIDGKFLNVPLVRSNMMKAVKGKGNKTTELKFCLALSRAGISGWKLHEKLIGNPDIFFPRYKLVIFLDGCFWHGCPDCGHVPKTNNAYWKTKIERNIERDIKKTLVLIDEGFIVLRFWEHELINDIDHCVFLLKEQIEESLIKQAKLVD